VGAVTCSDGFVIWFLSFAANAFVQMLNPQLFAEALACKLKHTSLFCCYWVFPLYKDELSDCSACLQISKADTQVSGCVWVVHLGRILLPGFCQGHHRRLAQPEGRRRLSQASCH